MADIDTVLERLVTEAAFRARLRSDPAGALAGYALSQDDLEVVRDAEEDEAAKKDGTISIRGKDISIRGSGDREG